MTAVISPHAWGSLVRNVTRPTRDADFPALMGVARDDETVWLWNVVSDLPTRVGIAHATAV